MSDDQPIRELYQRLLGAWNERNARHYAALFAPGGFAVGFDGSTHENPATIERDLAKIFADHPTAAYVGIVRDVRRLSSGVAILRAVAGMVPPGKSDLNPAANAIQTMVATDVDGSWRVAAFHNTPAAFHGRPQLAEALTEELREAVNRKSTQ